MPTSRRREQHHYLLGGPKICQDHKIAADNVKKNEPLTKGNNETMLINGFKKDVSTSPANRSLTPSNP